LININRKKKKQEDTCKILREREFVGVKGEIRRRREKRER